MLSSGWALLSAVPDLELVKLFLYVAFPALCFSFSIYKGCVADGFWPFKVENSLGKLDTLKSRFIFASLSNVRQNYDLGVYNPPIEFRCSCILDFYEFVKLWFKFMLTALGFLILRLLKQFHTLSDQFFVNICHLLNSCLSLSTLDVFLISSFHVWLYILH